MRCLSFRSARVKNNGKRESTNRIWRAGLHAHLRLVCDQLVVCDVHLVLGPRRFVRVYRVRAGLELNPARVGEQQEKICSRQRLQMRRSMSEAVNERRECKKAQDEAVTAHESEDQEEKSTRDSNIVPTGKENADAVEGRRNEETRPRDTPTLR